MKGGLHIDVLLRRGLNVVIARTAGDLASTGLAHRANAVPSLPLTLFGTYLALFFEVHLIAYEDPRHIASIQRIEHSGQVLENIHNSVIECSL